MRKAEAVLADPAAGMDDDAVADQRMRDRRMRADRAIAPDPHIRRRSRRPLRSRVPEPISARGPMTAPGSTVDAVLQPGGRMNEGAGRDAARPRTATTAAARPETAARATATKRAIRLARDQQRQATPAHPWRSARRSDRRRRRVVARPLGIFGIVEEGQIVRTGAVERRDAGDTPVGRRSASRGFAPVRSAISPTVSPAGRLEKKRLGHATMLQ